MIPFDFTKAVEEENMCKKKTGENMRKPSVIILIISLLMLASCVSTAGTAPEAAPGYTTAEKNAVRGFLYTKEQAEKIENLVSSLREADGNDSAVIDSPDWLTTHSSEKQVLMAFIKAEDLPAKAEIISFTSIEGSYSYAGGVSSVDITCTYSYQTAGSTDLRNGEYYLKGTVTRTENSLSASAIDSSGGYYEGFECTFSEGLYTSASADGMSEVNIALLNETARP